MKKLLIIAASVSAILALFSIYGLSHQVFLIGVLAFVFLATVLLIFERSVKNNQGSLSKTFLWFSMIIYMAMIIAFFTSIWFDTPLELSHWISNKSKPSVDDRFYAYDNITDFPENESFDNDSIIFREDMEASETPNNDAFELIQDDRTIDLTSLSSGGSSVVRWDRRIKVKKVDSCDILKIGYLSGDIDFSTEDNIKEVLFSYLSNRDNTITKKVYQVNLDVSKYKVGETFSVNLHNLYHGQFDQNNRSLDMKMYGSFNRISLKVLFNEGVNANSFNRIYRHNVNEKDTVEQYPFQDFSFNPVVTRKKTIQVASWIIKSPEFPATYQLSWKWTLPDSISE